MHRYELVVSGKALGLVTDSYDSLADLCEHLDNDIARETMETAKPEIKNPYKRHINVTTTDGKLIVVRLKASTFKPAYSSYAINIIRQ
jgi:hypothetical protein